MTIILAAAILVAQALPVLTHGPRPPADDAMRRVGMADSGAAVPPPESLRTRHGTLWQAVGHGPRYLAIPEGPGVRVRIIGPAGAVTVVSTDAGPALFRQREGRIGDLALGLWVKVCGAKRVPLGYCDATIAYGALPALPSTDTAP